MCGSAASELHDLPGQRARCWRGGIASSSGDKCREQRGKGMAQPQGHWWRSGGLLAEEGGESATAACCGREAKSSMHGKGAQVSGSHAGEAWL